MKTLLITIIFALSILPQTIAKESDIFDRLDSTLSRRELYSDIKERHIDSLQRLLHSSVDDADRLRIYNLIYDEYYTYRFDSAMIYVDRAENIARTINDERNIALSRIHRSILLSTTGYFSESIQNLQSIDRTHIDADTLLLIPYYTAYEWAYSMWAEYSDDKVYAPQYYAKEKLYQDSLVNVLPSESNLSNYWKAERLYRDNRLSEAEQLYQKALKDTPINVRLYAMASFGLALVSNKLGDTDKYEQYLIQAAISDQMCPLKENLALQELALHIFRTHVGETERANKYLHISMDDALFYNNRLRLLEIAQKIPHIVVTYQEENHQKNIRLTWSLIAISILSICLIIALLFIYRQIRLLNERQKIQTQMNDRLSQLNRELITTNHTREEYVSLFMELCAAYIEKLDKYQELVRRKIKAHQTDDLLRLTNTTRLSDADAKEFFVNFDTAFLNLYPTFIQEFNALLLSGEEIEPRRNEILNTDLRIFALIRLGIRDSSKIATLLFYSPQTIYNRRSAVKAKARDRDNFETQIQSLCSTI